MFAYAGASTFPTIQADMRDRGKFIYAAILAITILFLIYFPVAVGCYFSLGDQVTENIVLAMSSGWQRVVVEIMLLLHLITTFPLGNEIFYEKYLVLKLFPFFLQSSSISEHVLRIMKNNVMFNYCIYHLLFMFIHDRMVLTYI